MSRNIQEVITGGQHVGLPTNDLAATVAFYEQFGFENVYETVNEEADERVAFLRLGNLTIETYENHSAAERDGAWDHIALDVTDIEAAYAYAVEQGFPMMDAGVRSLPFWEKGVRFFTVLGPNRERLEFCQKL